MNPTGNDPEEDKFDKVLEKATKDPAYRTRLRCMPVETLREAGIDIPDGVEIRVREFDPNVRYLILPPSNQEEQSGKGRGNDNQRSRGE